MFVSCLSGTFVNTKLKAIYAGKKQPLSKQLTIKEHIGRNDILPPKISLHHSHTVRERGHSFVLPQCDGKFVQVFFPN